MEHSGHASRKERYYIESRYRLVNGDTAQAIVLLEELIEEYPHETLAYWTLGNIYRFLGETRETIRYLEAAIEVDPYYRDAYNTLVYAYNAVGDRESAFLAVNRYIEIAPDEANPYDTRGDLFLHHGDFDAALESYLKALEIKPDYYVSLQNCGRIYLRKQDYERADSCYRVCAKEGGYGLRAQAREALTYVPLLQGRFTRTMELLDSGVVVDEGDSEFERAIRKLIMKGRIQRAGGQFDEALATLWSCDSVSEVSGYASLLFYTDLVQTWADAGRYEEAEAGLKLIGDAHMGADSSLWNYWYLRAHIDFVQGHTDAAIRSLEGITDESVGFPVRYLLARAYLENGQLSRATEQFEGIRDDIGGEKYHYGLQYVRAQYYLGRAYEESRWPDKAIEQYESFLSYWGAADYDLPEIADARRRLARLQAES
jgi:tetratricopeptide (TPR) repeat protein